MKKIVSLFMLLFILLMLNGCSSIKDKEIIDNTEDIIKVSIKTQPGNDSSFKFTEDNKQISEITNYINTLELKKTNEDAGQYNGMSYVINVFYGDNTSREYILFGNFFMESGGDWYEIPYKQAEKFESIFKSMNSI